ncbi:MAG: DUF3560 domain-containing protein [Clostridia bacterium]|nr:DUF3560 domain-containing protein [Clostridia bacterium]
MHTYTYTVNNSIGCDTTTVKKIGLVGLYSGRQIKAKAAKGESITRSQSAKAALAAIKKKYGEVPDSAKFVHKGKGLWVRYSLANDKKRTGNVTEDIKKWRRQPNKYDYKGIDTASVKKAVTKNRTVKKIVQKPKFSTAQIRKPQLKLAGRTTKTAIKATGRPVLKTIVKPQKLKIVAEKRFLTLAETLQSLCDKEAHLVKNITSPEVLKTYNKKVSAIQRGKVKVFTALMNEKTTDGKRVKDKINGDVSINWFTYLPGNINPVGKFIGMVNNIIYGNDKSSMLPVPKRRVIKPKAKVNLKGSLGKLVQKKPVGRKEKVKPDKGISVVFGETTEYPAKATITGGTITVTCYHKDKKVYTSSLKVSEWETVLKNQEEFGYYSNHVLKMRTPKEHLDLYNKSSFNQIQAVDRAFRVYQVKIAEKKVRATTKREPGTFEHYGKNLLKGKYKDDFANLRSGITAALKEAYPEQLFMIAARGFYNSAADVRWTGGPSEAEVRKLGLGIKGSYWGSEDISRDVYWHKVTAEKFRAYLKGAEHNKALKTRAKISYTRKLKPADLEAPKPVIKMPAKIPTKTPAAVPQKKLKGRRTNTLQLKHAPVLKTGRPKPKVNKGFVVSGNTYPLKGQIKAMGGKWNKEEGGWIVPIKSAKAINGLKKQKGLKIRAIKTEEDVFRRLTEAERLDLRKAKYERKVERWETKSNKKLKEAYSIQKISDAAVEHIPIGQPILVGHHSEGVHRRALAKAQGNMFKAVDAWKESKEAGRKANILSGVAEDLGTVSDLKGRIAKKQKELAHARNKIARGESTGYYTQQEKNILADIKSMEDRLPAGAQEKPSYGVSMVMLGGAKLKPLVDATSVARRYHNKNLSGGNFAIEVRKGGKGVEVQGYHNIDGIVTSINVGPLYGIGASVITKENYKEFTVEKLAGIIKRALSM